MLVITRIELPPLAQSYEPGIASPGAPQSPVPRENSTGGTGSNLNDRYPSSGAGGLDECLDVLVIRSEDHREQEADGFRDDDRINNIEDARSRAENAGLFCPFRRRFDQLIHGIDYPVYASVIPPTCVDLSQDWSGDHNGPAFAFGASDHGARQPIVVREG